MKIVIKEGDFTTTQAQMIIHQVNCQGVMNSGAAKCVRDKYPVVFEEYHKLYEKNYTVKHLLLGKAQIVKINDNQYAVNVFGQFNYGYDGKMYTSYDALDQAFKYIAKYIKEHNEIKSIAFPYMFGCGRGGANWNVVSALIATIFKDLDITIELWEFKKQPNKDKDEAGFIFAPWIPVDAPTLINPHYDEDGNLKQSSLDSKYTNKKVSAAYYEEITPDKFADVSYNNENYLS